MVGIRRAGVALGAMVVLGAGSQAQAVAPYTVTSCLDAPGGASGAWELSDSNPASLVGIRDCSGDDPVGLYVRGRFHDGSEPGTQDAPAGARAEWVFDAPPGAVVTGYRLSRSLRTSGDDGWIAYVSDGAGAFLESCQTGVGVNPCHVGAEGVPPAPTATSRNGLRTNGLRVGVLCTHPFGTCSNGWAIPYSAAIVRAATVTLQDQSPPEIGAISGPLHDPGAWLHGDRQAVTVAVSDGGGGVGRVAIEDADGFTYGMAATEACDYTARRPCPATVTRTFTLDTRRLTAARGDGVHTLRVEAEDATRGWSSAHRVRSDPWRVQVDNTAPGAPAGLTISPRWPRADEPVIARWTTPGGQAAPITSSTWTLAPSDGRTAAVSGQSGPDAAGIGALGGGPEGLAGGRRVTLRVQLTDAAGNAGSAAAELVLDTTAPSPLVEAPGPVTAGQETAEIRVASTSVSAERAPVRSIRWSSCDAGGDCVAGAEPVTRTVFKVPVAPGANSVRVSFVNAAGVEGAPTTVRVVRPGGAAAGDGGIPSAAGRGEAAGVWRVARGIRTGRLIEVRVLTSRGWRTLRARVEQDASLSLPARMAATARRVRYRPLAAWRRLAVRDGRVRIPAARGALVQLRSPAGAARIRTVRLGRSLAVGASGATAAWRPAPGPFREARVTS